MSSMFARAARGGLLRPISRAMSTQPAAKPRVVILGSGWAGNRLMCKPTSTLQNMPHDFLLQCPWHLSLLARPQR